MFGIPLFYLVVMDDLFESTNDLFIVCTGDGADYGFY